MKQKHLRDIGKYTTSQRILNGLNSQELKSEAQRLVSSCNASATLQTVQKDSRSNLSAWHPDVGCRMSNADE